MEHSIFAPSAGMGGNLARTHVAVIGAGLAGLSCASALQEAGFEVSVFDKGRGPGGRMSTRRGAGWQGDHGAQYFTARDLRFCAEAARWEQAGVAARWNTQVVAVDADGAVSACTPTERFVGMPGMTAPAAWLAGSLTLHTDMLISTLRRDRAGWRLHVQGGEPLALHYDAVVLALPAPQAQALLRDVAPLQAALAGAAKMESCWAMMLQFGAPLALGFEAAFVNRGPLRWVARDSSKPGRAGSESWILHASAEWSDAHLELDADSIAAHLLPAFAALGAPAPERWSAHRWRYAKAAQVRNEECIWVNAQSLGLCGDWLGGGTVEAAWLSGLALAQRITASQPASRLGA